jgi:hypothetical protein
MTPAFLGVVRSGVLLSGLQRETAGHCLHRGSAADLKDSQARLDYRVPAL